MENKTMELALKFEHRLERLGDGKFTEYFIPYEVKELRSNKLLSGKKEKKLFSYYAEGGEPPELNGILQRYDISEAWVNEGGTYQETSLFDYIADVAYVTESVTWRHGENQSDAATVAQVGILTTVVGIQFLQFKIDFSILYRMLLNRNLFDVVERNREAFIDVLYNIAQRSLDSDGDKEEFSKERIREQLDAGQTPNNIIKALIRKIYATVQKRLPHVYSLQVSSNYDVYLQQVVNAIKLYPQAAMHYTADDCGCFCVVDNDDKIYYAFSGDDSDKPKDFDKFSKLVKQNLDREFNREATQCCISDETLCYGVRDKEFWAFPKSLSYKDYRQECNRIRYCYSKLCGSQLFSNTVQRMSNKYCCSKLCVSQLSNELSVGSLYGCCERKIFVNTKNQMPMEVHCRWAPCQRCAPAVYEEINRHSHFEYIALAKGFNDFKKTVKGGTYCFPRWILTKASY